MELLFPLCETRSSMETLVIVYSFLFSTSLFQAVSKILSILHGIDSKLDTISVPCFESIPWRMLNILETAWKSEVENRNEYTITGVSIELRVSQSGNKSRFDRLTWGVRPNKNIIIRREARKKSRHAILSYYIFPFLFVKLLSIRIVNILLHAA